MNKLLIIATISFVFLVDAVEATNELNDNLTISGGGGSQPVGTGFNYQGELIENGQIVTTPRVFAFSLYDSSVGGSQLGATIEYGTTIFPTDEPGHPVNNGLFFIQDMNFGDQYDGSKVWLEITVRAPDLENCGAPNPPCSIAEILTPRQTIKAVPYAVQADYLGPIGATDGDILQFDGDEWLPESPSNQPWGTVGGGGQNYISYTGGDIHVRNGGATIGSGNDSPTNGLAVAGQTLLTDTTDADLSPSSGVLVIGDLASDNLVFDGNEIMARDNGVASTLLVGASGGSIINGTTAGSGLLAIGESISQMQIDGDDIQRKISGSPSILYLNFYGGDVRIGSAGATTTISGTVNTPSDMRLKKDIVELPYGLAEILTLQPKAYNWKNIENNGESFGLIAQDVQEIMPELVTDNLDKEGNEFLSLSYMEMIPVLVKGMQEQQAIIDDQNRKIDKLMKLFEDSKSL